ncbi:MULTISPECIES: heavy metal translocating P-type ATPase [Niastella]|uniref:Heavy metal translocating P-type ATPase metal-binding domain-containing protein n=1 Tax=Niastella soli TaxID=2821487 RepID=A0ABS3YVG3_9BACT|nr:heavy metal translocating P-type ATPase metal-binding domain-containing protein [Niastella soli]MBO9201905.1 heavy metal translocating P-type ATPase metal-binding domain-containing protein [Niastella soli]
MRTAVTGKQTACYHCGENCQEGKITSDGKYFCCEGCKMVYQLLNQNGLCEYYDLNGQPGASQRITVRKDKFSFLEVEDIQRQLISFKDDKQTNITFYLPQIHCSSCLYLLENLHKLHAGVISGVVNFTRKEVAIVFDHNKISLRKVAELLTSIGYEPYISLNNLGLKKTPLDRQMIYRLGIAGFCFANIMLTSFPEYLGLEGAERSLQGIFRTLNFILALPVFFYSAFPFFSSGWKALKHKHLNIDAPIALAILITYSRSVYEVLSGTGGGYFDSMSGIVFFMLVGRVFQDKTYQQLSFERDFTSYFPVAVSVLKDDKEIPTALPDIKVGDTLVIHNEELIPADGILTRGKGFIDYSFVTGESVPVTKEMGEIVYAGGKQTGSVMEILVVKEVAQSYLAKLWSDNDLKKREEKNGSFVQLLSRWFTFIVFGIATIAAVYWSVFDSSKVWNAITAVLIVACPCALLLSNTFTNGVILRILGRNKFYLRNAQVIEEMAKIDHIVFDKTGTLAAAHDQEIAYFGKPLSNRQLLQIATLAANSNHPLSKALVNHIGRKGKMPVNNFIEITGMGIEGQVGDHFIKLGAYTYVTGKADQPEGTAVYVCYDQALQGCFQFSNQFRESVPELVKSLKPKYGLSVLSGDNEGGKTKLERLLGYDSVILFNQRPEDKLHYIQSLQIHGKKVMMVGDGLNDAGALIQSNVGIAVTEDCNNFTPASDAIIDAGQLSRIPVFIRLCKVNKRIVLVSFILSIAYNIIGISFSVQGDLSPLIAAILMPASSLSILLVTFGSGNIAARLLKC